MMISWPSSRLRHGCSIGRVACVPCACRWVCERRRPAPGDASASEGWQVFVVGASFGVANSTPCTLADSRCTTHQVNLLRCLLKRAKGRPHVLDLLRTCIRERESLHTLYQMFSIVIECARQAVAPATPKSSKWYFYDPEDEAAGSPSEASGDSGEGEGAFGSSVGKREKGPATNVLEQGDMHQEVLLRVCSEESVDGDYLIAVVTEYLRSLRYAKRIPQRAPA